MKQISIIVTVYNKETTLKRCLESIYKNNLENTELIIVNDGSTDKSADIIKEYTNKHKRNKSNKLHS